MSDRITIDELKMFLGTGLSGFVDDDVCLLSSLTEMGHIVVSRYDFDLDFRAKNFRPCVRPWSHLTREIEHNGERFIPIVKLGICQGVMTPKMEFYHYRNTQKSRSFSYRDALKMAEWHIDLFGWLDRTGDDGQPLAVEMEG